MNVPKVNEVDMISPWWLLELEHQYAPTNTQWYRVDNDYYTQIKTDVYPSEREKQFKELKNDPWGRPLIPWKVKYAQPGEDCYEPQNWKPDSGPRRFYRYVAVAGNCGKLVLIFKNKQT